MNDLISRVENSPQYNKLKKRFQNRRPNLIREMDRNFLKKFSISKFLIGMFRVQRHPLSNLPEVKPDISEFIKYSDNAKIIWLGHSSLLLNISGKNILIDPIFSKYASPVPFVIKRFQSSVLSIDELPEIDYVIISHDHYDHLDKKTIKCLLNRGIKFIIPLLVGKHLRKWGVSDADITELDWWEDVKLDGEIEIIATPAQHFSGRGFKRNTSLWASWVIKSKTQKIFFSADSGYDTHFKAIGDKYGPFDIALMENGQYNNAWQEVHMMPDETAQAYFDLKAKAMIPIHWAMFVISLHSWRDPIENISRISEDKSINLITPRLGEIVTVNNSNQFYKWW